MPPIPETTLAPDLDQPWLRRDDWRRGQVKDTSRQSLIVVWVLAVVWNLTSGTLTYHAIQNVARWETPALVAALLFPVVGVGLFWWAGHLTARYRRFGVSVLELATVPGVIGRSLAGTARIPGDIAPTTPFRAVLSRIERVTTGGGRNRRTIESVEWQEVTTTTGTRDARGVAVPVAFRIPFDQPASNLHNRRNGTLWRLELSAKVPGVNYHATFEVPVFRTAESGQPLTAEESAGLPSASSIADYRQPADSRIRVSVTRRGTEIVFGRGRNPGLATAVTCFTAFWCGMVWALIHWSVPLFFQVAFGGVALLLLNRTMWLWLGVSRVAVGDGAVAVSRGMLWEGAPRRIPAADITDVVVTIGMSAGRTPYYDVRLVRENHLRRVTAGGQVRDKREAEWLAELIRRAVAEA